MFDCKTKTRLDSKRASKIQLFDLNADFWD